MMNVKLSPEKAQEIFQAAGEILEKIGLRISDPLLLEELKNRDHLTQSGNRILISAARYEQFLEEQKKKKTKKDKHGTRLHGEASLYTWQYRDPEDHVIKPYTTQSLAQCASFIEKASKSYPVNPVICGYPSDVPSELSSLARYKIAAENCSGCWPMAPDSLISAKYMFEMAEVMGEKMTHLPVYMISPLTYGGDSLQIVLENKDKLESFYTFSMPNLGVTTPMNLAMGFAQTFAEVAGGAILTEELTGLAGEVRPNLFPFDMKYFNIAFGSTEKFLAEQMAASLCGYLHGEEPDYSSTNIHTWAKYPDGCSAMEKGMMIMAGALQGARRFYCTGALSLDEVFDPLEMLLDLEAICFAQRILDGPIEDEIESSMLDEITEGIHTGFVNSDRTLDEYSSYVDSRSISPKENLQVWIQKGQKKTEDYLYQMYQEINRRPVTYQLDKERQTELDRIFESAKSHFQR